MELLDIRLAKVIDNEVFEEKSTRINKKIELFETEARKIRDYISHRDKVKDRVEKFKTIFQKNATLKEFDADVFESIIDKIIIGRRNDDGSIDPYEVGFVLKTGDELTDTLPIKKIPSQMKKAEKDDFNERMEELQSQLGAFAHNEEYCTCNSSWLNCLLRKQL